MAKNNKPITLTVPPELFSIIESRAKKADKPIGSQVRFMVMQLLSYEQFMQQVPEFKELYEESIASDEKGRSI